MECSSHAQIAALGLCEAHAVSQQEDAHAAAAADLSAMYTKRRLKSCRFHEVEPQKNLHVMAPPQVISQQLLRRNHALIPFPALSEKTLVLAEYAVVGTADTPDNQLSLMARWSPWLAVTLLMQCYLHQIDMSALADSLLIRDRATPGDLLRPIWGGFACMVSGLSCMKGCCSSTARHVRLE